MLVNVYGSKELFVNEYRTLLADRLLTQYSCDTEKEIRYLELLKLRFGDSQLHYCEVKIKTIPLLKSRDFLKYFMDGTLKTGYIFHIQIIVL